MWTVLLWVRGGKWRNVVNTVKKNSGPLTFKNRASYM